MHNHACTKHAAYIGSTAHVIWNSMLMVSLTGRVGNCKFFVFSFSNYLYSLWYSAV